MSLQPDSNSDNESDYYDRDPGREVVEKNVRNRLQRIANHTKDELNKVLKRVDTTLNNYEYSVQASLIQHGMSANDMTNVEHVADIKELEHLLNDSIAKQRYKQRLMVFIVGQTEQASEKAKLLQQIEQFFSEQKQSFSAKEFNTYDDQEPPDEIDIALKSFDVKDCYVHVKTLGTRLNELNEEIMHYLIENAGSKQQVKGKKKLAQVAKETKEQLTSLQLKLEIANNEMNNRDNQIETLTKEIETQRDQSKIQESNLQYQLRQYETEIEFCKTTINELEDSIGRYRVEIEDLTTTISTMQQPETEDTTDTKITDVPNQDDVEEVQLDPVPNAIIRIPSIEKFDKETQTTVLSDENSEQTDLNSTTIENLQEEAIVHMEDLVEESEIKESVDNETTESLQQQLNECREAFAIEQNELMERTHSAYQLQIKAQKAAEEAISHLQAYMKEKEEPKPESIHQETQTEELTLEEAVEAINLSFQLEQETSEEMIRILEPTNLHPVEESFNDHSFSHSKITTEELESIEHFRRESLKDKYISLIEGKKQELDQLKQQADLILSRPTSIRERIGFQSSETILLNQRPSLFSFVGGEEKENPTGKQDQEQQTSLPNSRESSAHKEKMITQMAAFEQYKSSFFHLYETVYKFRQAIVNILEQNQLVAFANCLQMIRQLSSDDQILTKDFLENAERVLKDITKVLQTCMTTLQSTIEKYQNKEKAMGNEPKSEMQKSSMIDQQSINLEQKESMLIDLTIKYEQLTKVLDQVNIKHEEEVNTNQSLIHDQQKIIQTFQQELTRLQTRLLKIETEGVIEPSIMFTRLDAERNEQTLQQAVDKGKVSETAYNELNETMGNYVELPAQQLSTLVKRYIQFRRATEIEDRIQSEIFDRDTTSVLQRMESLHERRSGQMSERMTHIRRQRTDLAKVLTEKFDQLEEECSIFLIRPIYSYQGRAAAQSYLQHEKRRQEQYFKEYLARKRHNPSRQTAKTRPSNNQQIPRPSSSRTVSDDDERLFRIEKSAPSSNEKQKEEDIPKPISVQFSGLTRLQELDIQRALMPVSHPSTTLIPAFTNNVVDPASPSLNLRSYLAISRPGVDNLRMGKMSEVAKPVSRERHSVLSAKSQTTNPRTPYNSTNGDLRRVGAPLPPIKRSLTTGATPMINNRQHSGFALSISANGISTTE